MKITSFTDFALRLLMYLAVKDARTSVSEAAAVLEVSPDHLAKVAARLRELGFIDALRGRGGGIRLAVPTQDINVGEVFDALERPQLVECFDAKQSRCVLGTDCGLRPVLDAALEAFTEVLRQHTLADLVHQRPALKGALQLVSLKGGEGDKKRSHQKSISRRH